MKLVSFHAQPYATVLPVLALGWTCRFYLITHKSTTNLRTYTNHTKPLGRRSRPPRGARALAEREPLDHGNEIPKLPEHRQAPFALQDGRRRVTVRPLRMKAPHAKVPRADLPLLHEGLQAVVEPALARALHVEHGLVAGAPAHLRRRCGEGGGGGRRRRARRRGGVRGGGEGPQCCRLRRREGGGLGSDPVGEMREQRRDSD